MNTSIMLFFFVPLNPPGSPQLEIVAIMFYRELASETREGAASATKITLEEE